MITFRDFIKETADLYVKNSKSVMRIETYKKFFPMIFSSLVTLLLSILRCGVREKFMNFERGEKGSADGGQ